MSTELIVTCFVALLGIVVTIALACVAAYNRMTERMTKVETKFEMFVFMIGKGTAKAFHSPHTPELDALLEKYMDRHHELSLLEWMRLKEICDETIGSVKSSKHELQLAGIMSAVCEHKMNCHYPIKKEVRA